MQWHEIDSSIEDLFGQVGDANYAFTTSAEARIAAYEGEVCQLTESLLVISASMHVAVIVQSIKVLKSVFLINRGGCRILVDLWP